MTGSLPYVTSKALIRYSSAKAPERQRIVREIRDEPFSPFKVWYGGEIEGAFRKYLAGHCRDDEPLASLEQTLEKRPHVTEADENKILKQLDAIENFRQTDFQELVENVSISSDLGDLQPFEIEAVKVSLRPSNVLRATFIGEKGTKRGVVVPYLSSTSPLSPDSGKLFAALAHWYATKALAHADEADYRLCYVVDVFQNKVFRAPKAFTQRRNLLSALCIEYSALWSTLPKAASKGKSERQS